MTMVTDVDVSKPKVLLAFWSLLWSGEPVSIVVSGILEGVKSVVLFLLILLFPTNTPSVVKPTIFEMLDPKSTIFVDVYCIQTKLTLSVHFINNEHCI